MDTSNKFTVEVQQYEDSEDLFVEFPEELMQELGWKEDDIINWDIQDNNTIIISRVEDSSSTEEEHQQTHDWYSVKEDAIKEYIIDQSAEEVKQDIINAEKFLQTRDQDSEQSQDGDVSPPDIFPHFP
jgi:bifunctional DNA-binding transcriptional regulator/antitoxin component of YhaV-PrlF toxin-antitoxin module